MTNYRLLACAALCLITLLTGCLGGSRITRSSARERLDDLQHRAQLSFDQGLHDDARLLLQEALQLADSLDDRPGQVSVLVQQARLARKLGDLPQARRLAAQAMTVAAGGRDVADVDQERSLQELAAGQLDKAVVWAERARQDERDGQMGRRLNLLARLALLQGREEDAARLAGQALEQSATAKLASERANALRVLGIINGRRHRFAEGRRFLTEALVLDRSLELPVRIAADLDALADLAGLAGDPGAREQFRARAATVRAAMAGAASPP